MPMNVQPAQTARYHGKALKKWCRRVQRSSTEVVLLHHGEKPLEPEFDVFSCNALLTACKCSC